MSNVPKMTLHAASGRARVRIPKRLRRPGEPQDLYLGPWGSQESHRRYAAFLTDIAQVTTPPEITARAGRPVLVCELAAAWRKHIETTLPGRTEDAIIGVRSRADIAVALLVEKHHAVRVPDFDSACLDDIIERMKQSNRWNWRVGKDHIRRIRSIFAWGVRRKMTPPAVMIDLNTIDLPMQGMPGWRPIGPRKVAPIQHVRMVIDDLLLRGQVQVAGILTVQAMTGSRCGEIRQARLGELDRDRRLLVIRRHKTFHLTGQPKAIPLPDSAIAAIDRAILVSGVRDPDSAIFTSSRGKGQPLKANGVRAAIKTACDRLGIPTFTPHGIRRLAATELRRTKGADVAQATGQWNQPRMVNLYGADAGPELARQGVEELERQMTA